MQAVEKTEALAHRRWVIVLVSVLAGLGLLVTGALFGMHVMAGHGGHHMSTEAAMSSRAQQVMPFDLTRTAHTFTQTATGGVERVVVADSTDARDLRLIRAHLSTEAGRFRAGDYADPAAIHGMDMPGLAALQAGAARVTVTYTELASGAQITYSSTEPGLVSAIHVWFDRQASDHNMPGMGG